MNDAETLESPEVEVAVVDSRPGTPRIADSIGVETSASTTSGLAPGYWVTTTSCGRVTDGNSSCLSVVSATLPKMPTTMVSRAMSARLRRLNTDSRCTGLLVVKGEDGTPLCTGRSQYPNGLGPNRTPAG